MSEFFSMSGDGVFVWPCYLLTFFVLLANVVLARRRYRALVRRIETVHMRKP